MLNLLVVGGCILPRQHAREHDVLFAGRIPVVAVSSSVYNPRDFGGDGMDTVTSWLGGDAKTISFAVLSGVVGFLAKSAYDLWTARRKDQLERVNSQLRLFYGPLYALHNTSNLAWNAFRIRTRPGGAFFATNPPPNEQELEAWRGWMLIVFQPIHDEMLSIITRNADLLIESDLPTALQLFCAHVTAYKVVFNRWSQHDFSEHTSVLNYPTSELSQYFESSFKGLKSDQARLLGARARGAQRGIQSP
jgi:hypothetical protein